MKVYLVGGAVRDKLLNTSSNDRDYVVVGSTIQEMENKGFIQVGKNFPVFIHPTTNEEYALARSERKIGNKHTDFEFIFDSNITLEEDLIRRDFTINAMALDENNTVIDYFNGQADLRNKIIRAVRPETFVEDTLRILRGCRFAAQLDFNIEPETMELFKKMVADGMLEFLTPERVWKETEKALTQGYNSPKYFELLNECGALKVLMPEIYKLTTTPERLEYHPSGNTFKHTMIALSRLQHKNSIAKFMILCHDLGKGVTPEDILPSHNGHDERGLPIIDNFCNRLKIPNIYRDNAKHFCKHHMKLGKFEEMNVRKHYDIVKEISNNFKNVETVQNIIYCFYADWTGEEFQTAWNDTNECLKIMNHIMNVFYTMKDINIKDLPENIQNSLMKFKGEKFGQLYRDAMIDYLRHNLKTDVYNLL